FTKSPQFPFHISLPKPIPPPTPLTPYLHSPTILKPPIFLLFSFTPLLPLTHIYLYILTFLRLITILFPSLTPLPQYHIKPILTYSTITQLPMIISMLPIPAAYPQHTSDHFS
ncbi:proton-conducting transporter transmembrane domain-containing protein, partial [Staphylococcus capitis]|uniref:proton-conducting transporter transmembrane domain-containing protein n=1 Tax=Staphylococcus capitis TaxID=29388 RepID=UPI0021B386E2